MKAPKDHFIVQIDITNACGHKCSNCTRFCGHIKNPYFMDYDYFCKAVDTLLDHPGIIGVMGGEPTLHPRFEEMCQYLQKTVGKRYPVDATNFKYPTDRLVEERLRDQLTRYEIEEYEDGPRAIIKGTGLWTSVTPQYLRHYEIIQDTFNWQNLNDHSSASFHQPIMITHQEMGISEDKWRRLREKCWVNQEWSGSVTPKGCFFCEVAGAFDMIYDGPGGLPLEEGWWKRPIEDYKDQFRWCEMCGIPLKTFSRDAREETDDISQYHYDKLSESRNVALGKKKTNVLKITNGQIDGRNIGDIDKYRGQTYIDDVHDRVAFESPVYAKELYGVLLDDGRHSIEELTICIEHNKPLFKELVIISKSNEKELGIREFVYVDNFIGKFKECLDWFGRSKYVIAFTPQIIFSEKLSILKKCVINPGTLHYSDFSKRKVRSIYHENADSIDNGICMLINTNAFSLYKIEANSGDVYHCLRLIGRQWNKKKIVHFSDAMNKNIYKVNGVNEKRRRVTDFEKLIKRFIENYGVGKMMRFLVSTLKHYGVKLTADKIKGRVY